MRPLELRFRAAAVAIALLACADALAQPAPGAALVPVSGTVEYEAREENADRTDWSPEPVRHPATGFLVVSQGADGRQYDAAYTQGDPAGAFTIHVPAQPAPGDTVFVVAATLADPATWSLALAVATAGHPPSTREVDSRARPPAPALWSWSWPAADLASGRTALVITEAMGSGAAHTFEYVRAAHATAVAEYGRAGPPLVVWLGYDTAWECWACFNTRPIEALRTRFESQIWFSGSTADGSFWQEAVVAHEVGHWVMASFGRFPADDGLHTVGTPSFPGMAWQEGFATWYGSYVRRSPVEVWKIGGTMTWLDISRRATSAGPTQRPTPDHPDGLLQPMDEQEVAAILWILSGASPDAPARMLRALASARMVDPPFERGYTAKAWETDPETKQPYDVRDTGISSPCLPDFLDALACDGFPPPAIDAATDPAQHYPYPSSAPLCRAAPLVAAPAPAG